MTSEHSGPDLGPGNDGSTGGTITWQQLRDEAERRLRSAQFEHPHRDARWIVERASGLEGVEWVLAADEPATERGVHFFDVMLARRLDGEPLQYVLGRWGFRTLDLMVDDRVLIPRPETEVVAGVALERLEQRRSRATEQERPLRAVDLGTGSGAIGLSLAAECRSVEVWITDRSSASLDVARANLAGLGEAATRVRVAEGDWFDALPSEMAGTIDVVVSNPPYVATGDPLPEEVSRWEPHRALFAGDDGLDDLRVLVHDAPRWLAPGGWLVVEMAPVQAPVVAHLAQAVGLVDVDIRVDLSGRDRMVVARRAS